MLRFADQWMKQLQFYFQNSHIFNHTHRKPERQRLKSSLKQPRLIVQIFLYKKLIGVTGGI